MKEQLVSFETAKLAKEKGFDIFTDYSFYSDGKETVSEYGCEDILIFRPTQSLLQKWLRENYKIYVNTHLSFVEKHSFYTTVMWIKTKRWIPKNMVTRCPEGCWSSDYEESLEVGLKYALTQIK